ncbi:hypothetical protein AJ78_02309 [Emergomyces pasteurianus Ep9510]|uniref:Uncharacterized protein n=1 Tax=Emergomyces pasteurianus Ep9510 TaxID=1447872 RepID=A0A1J9PNZ8_9EURO|nr:hypothetical protein AJ78_02309 [Emergomyces pasteurianus Ep9510]
MAIEKRKQEESNAQKQSPNDHGASVRQSVSLSVGQRRCSDGGRLLNLEVGERYDNTSPDLAGDLHDKGRVGELSPTGSLPAHWTLLLQVRRRFILCFRPQLVKLSLTSQRLGVGIYHAQRVPDHSQEQATLVLQAACTPKRTRAVTSYVSAPELFILMQDPLNPGRLCTGVDQLPGFRQVRPCPNKSSASPRNWREWEESWQPSRNSQMIGASRSVIFLLE